MKNLPHSIPFQRTFVSVVIAQSVDKSLAATTLLRLWSATVKQKKTVSLFVLVTFCRVYFYFSPFFLENRKSKFIEHHKSFQYKKKLVK